MDSSDSVTVVRLAAAVIVMFYASVLDWRTRRVSNVYWIGLSILGLVLLPVQILIDDQPIEYLLVLIPILVILADVYWDVDEGTALAKFAPALKYILAVVLIIVLGYFWLKEPYFQHLLAVPVMMLFIVALYMLDIVRGGADAKALLALSILFPFYPAIGSIPILEAESETAEILFPFSFIILITAAIIVAFFPIGFALKNLSAGEFAFPQGFLGYKMNVEDVVCRHVWLMERVENGKHVVYSRPRAEEDLKKEISLLAEGGFKRVWITPKIPFVVPMSMALVFAAVIGNVLLVFFQA